MLCGEKFRLNTQTYPLDRQSTIALLYILSTFIHLHRIIVKEGQYVQQGDVIAEIGATGRVTGAHLDWRVNLFKRRLDPQLILKAMPASAKQVSN